MTANQKTQLRMNADFNFQNLEISKTFFRAAQKFIRKKKSHYEILAASQDWFFEPWGRDVFIALPGILLARGKFKMARSIFENFSQYEKNGLIPNRITEKEILYNTSDASLWFIMALEKYFLETQDQKFIQARLPTLENILDSYTEGTGYERFGKFQAIMVDPKDGLLITPSQSTWMDADPSGNGSSIVTPRNGKCVEINALFYSSLKFVSAFVDREKKASYEKLVRKIKKNFSQKFWNSPENCLLDVIEGDPHSGAIRPNQIFAVSHGKDLLSQTKQKQVFQTVTQDLLTLGGLRTLSPRDSNYRGNYNTFAPINQKDWSYHQGTVWPWLMGAYIDSLVKIKHFGKTEDSLGVLVPDSQINRFKKFFQPKKKNSLSVELQAEVRYFLQPLVQFCLESESQSLPEVFSGDSPYEPGGTRSQAWSVGEVLRVLKQYAIV